MSRNDEHASHGHLPPAVQHWLVDQYSYDPDKQPLLVEALKGLPDLSEVEKGRYHYKIPAHPDGFVDLVKGRLTVNSFSHFTAEALNAALLEAAGSLLEHQGQEDVDLLEQVLSGDISAPLFEGGPSLLEMASRMGVEDEFDAIRRDYQELDALYAGSGAHDEVSIADALSRFLQHRYDSVSEATYRRDEKVLDFFEVFLNMAGWDLVGLEDEEDGLFITSVTYHAMYSTFMPFLLWASKSEFFPSATSKKALRSTLKTVTKWTRDEGMISDLGCRECHALLDAVPL